MSEQETIKAILDTGLKALGLNQILYPNVPRKRDNKEPYAQVEINMRERAPGDLGPTPRTSGFVRVSITTPYGKDPLQHDEFVNGTLDILSDQEIDNIQFFTSTPETVGRSGAWWITRVDTRFNLEGV